MNEQNQISEWYQSTFADFERSLNGEAEAEFHHHRRRALQRFGEIGFPTTRHEEWRFTNISPIAEARFKPVTGEARPPDRSEVGRFFFNTRHRLVFVDGRFAAELSSMEKLPKGVRAGSLAAAVKSRDPETHRFLAQYATDEENAFIALNTAFARDGAFIFVPDGVVMEDSIHVVYIATGMDQSLLTPRNLVIAGTRSQLSFVESYVSLKDGRYLTNAVTELIAGEGAIVEHDKLQNESVQAYHISVIQTHQGRQSSVTSNAITLGGAIVRNNVTAVLDGEGAECTLNGLSLGNGSQLIDNHTAIDHAKPHCESHELYKAVLDGKAHGVFNGKIFVRKDAQKTNAKQTNKTLLLSDNAFIDTKPQLEIFADDVKCTHGATVGQLDADQIFYLRTRGIGADAARDILTFAFATDVVEKIHVEPLKELLGSLVQAKLEKGRKRS